MRGPQPIARNHELPRFSSPASRLRSERSRTSPGTRASKTVVDESALLRTKAAQRSRDDGRRRRDQPSLSGDLATKHSRDFRELARPERAAPPSRRGATSARNGTARNRPQRATCRARTFQRSSRRQTRRARPAGSVRSMPLVTRISRRSAELLVAPGSRVRRRRRRGKPR